MIASPSDDPGLCGFDAATGFRCAEALGLDAYLELGDGFDGRAYALDEPEDRVLKVSRHPTEAALAALLLRERTAGRPIAGFPEIHAVYRLEVEGVYGPLWAILRESVEDPYPNPSPEEALARARLGEAIERLVHGWRTGRAGLAELAAADPGHDLGPVAAALPHLRDRHGLTVGDLGLSAFGTTRSGGLVIRDFGRVSGSPAAIGSLLDSLPDPVPVPLVRRGLAP